MLIRVFEEGLNVLHGEVASTPATLSVRRSTSTFAVTLSESSVPTSVIAKAEGSEGSMGD